MDLRSMTPAASSLAFLYTNIAKAIKDITEKYNAAPTTSSISAECSAISGALVDIQLLLSQPHALSSRVISQVQLEEALKKAQNGCNFTISRVEEEVGKWMGSQATTKESLRTWSMAHICDEVMIKGLLQQTQRQLTDISLLIAAAQRNSSSEIRQLLQNDTFMGDLIDRRDRLNTASSSKPGGYSQSLWEHFDDSRPVYTQPSNASLFSFRSGNSGPYSPLDDDAASVLSRSTFAPSVSDKTKKTPRANMGSVFFKLFKSNTELHRAARKGDAKKIKALLDLGVDINYEGTSGCTALHLATDGGHEAAVRVLLENGADSTAKSSEGRSPLHSAARAGHTAVVRLLLEKGVNIHAKDPSGSTPLHIAAYNGQESVVQILLEKHPWVEVKGPAGFTALHVAAFTGQSAVVRLLIEMRANVEARSDTGRTALQLAAEKGHEAVVRHLLQHGANIMAKDNNGRTALQGAVSNQHGVVAQLLLDKVMVLEAPSHGQLQRSSGSEPTYELDTGGPPAWSGQALDEPIYELPAASVGVRVELPADDFNAGLRKPMSTTERMTLLSHQKEAWET